MIGKILSIGAKVILGMFAVGAAASVATAYYAGKAGQNTRERIDETVQGLQDQAQGAMDSLGGPTASPSHSM
ncbi:MAG: hypothetical protein KY468_02395 [Armatimonadetes bacterium]|nr:hypothetical protein [Armatimonadota bacterium]